MEVSVPIWSPSRTLSPLTFCKIALRKMAADPFWATKSGTWMDESTSQTDGLFDSCCFEVDSNLVAVDVNAALLHGEEGTNNWCRWWGGVFGWWPMNAADDDAAPTRRKFTNWAAAAYPVMTCLLLEWRRMLGEIVIMREEVRVRGGCWCSCSVSITFTAS